MRRLRRPAVPTYGGYSFEYDNGNIYVLYRRKPVALFWSWNRAKLYVELLLAHREMNNR